MISKEHSPLTKEEINILMCKYGLRYRTATEFYAFDDHTRKWIMRMMELAYEKGRYDKNHLDRRG
jgi:hypothetical protein